MHHRDKKTSSSGMGKIKRLEFWDSKSDETESLRRGTGAIPQISWHKQGRGGTDFVGQKRKPGNYVQISWPLTPSRLVGQIQCDRWRQRFIMGVISSSEHPAHLLQIIANRGEQKIQQCLTPLLILIHCEIWEIVTPDLLSPLTSSRVEMHKTSI